MPAVFKRTAPYKDDALNLPVADVEAAIPFYVDKLGFRVVERRDSPVPTAILGRDAIQIRLAQNGGDPEQEGCYFEVDDIAAAYMEVNGKQPPPGALEIQSFGGKSSSVFFVVAPDGLCFMLGQPVS